MEKARVEEASRNVRRYIADGLLNVKNEDVRRFVGFFISYAETSLQTAGLLFQLSEDQAVKDALRVSKEYESYLWVIVTSYYSMFYAATAPLAREGIKASGEIVHKVTADAFIHFFISNRKLAKLLEEYEEVREVGLQLVGRDELFKRIERKASELVIAYEGERRKRSRFQYDVGVSLKRGYAQTSLERARQFVFEIKKLLQE